MSTLVRTIATLLVLHLTTGRVHCDESAVREYNRICSFYEQTKKLFLADMEVSPSGCKVDCLTLSSSDQLYNMFFDLAVTYSHTVSDGTHCGQQDICISGHCLPKPTQPKYQVRTRLGVALIIVQKAHVPKKDRLSKADPYVQVFMSTADHQLQLLGTTSTVRNHHEPDFNQHFSTPPVAATTRIVFKVFDYDDMDEDDLVGEVGVGIDELVDTALIGRSLKKKVPGGWILFTIFWRPQL